MNGKRLRIIAIILNSTILLMPTFYPIRVGMVRKSLFGASTRFASSIVIMLVATVTLIWPIAFT